MTVLIILVVVLLLLGVLGAVIKGLLWLTLIALLLGAALIAYGWWKFRGATRSR